ncbi:uncharacterized protein LAESUDRAFT_723049 [Laetiporus sulphureus 93-53]|uniref:MATH domain-containing protein n=1 Tax=Laetiporus sulphureus 93-53 TaxID=1314785 RepID=A0A165FQB0_9APHY|nr:uncharacterized protein LAESUDRAFT_723049 [Laetiporus sulphureus 93-53]KZT09315.1 hypothetical protein LAESUDRAFT_723049 [Laetiporus sulphureus 93-53]
MDNSSATSDYQESVTLRFEWVIRNVKAIYESSKGESKSNVMKSAKFGRRRWQVLFYANSGSVSAEGHTYISLYLSCEPTAEELEDAVDSKWVRDGAYNFGFELRNLRKTVLISDKEAHDHSFTHQTQNWGWAQFARRNDVFNQPSVKQHDTVLVICSITTTPTSPTPPPAIPRRLVPRDLIDVMGGLLDDPIYSDVEFILPRRGRSRIDAKKIYASRKLLTRVEYFATMFQSGFSEGLLTNASSQLFDVDSSGDTTSLIRRFDDSDEEEDEDDLPTKTPTEASSETIGITPSTERRQISVDSTSTRTDASRTSVRDAAGQLHSVDSDAIHARNVRAKLSHPSSPRSEAHPLEQQDPDSNTIETSREDPFVFGPNRIRIVVEDVAYTTYRAVLYYIYTDKIVFAPLSSSFILSAATSANNSPVASSSSSQANVIFSQPPSNQQSESSAAGLTSVSKSRREWITQWERKNGSGRPCPCSAKSVYRLADRLDLQELKQRARDYIVKSLTVDNVAYEVFSTFSAAFEEIRKVEVRFFLDHWKEIRESDSMRNVWQQIRLGRHPGFEEVWPVIAVNLEYKARPGETASGSGKGGASGGNIGC